MRILSITQGKFGKRFVSHIQETAPDGWEIIEYPFTASLPAVVDDPEEFLPEDLPEAELMLYFGQNKILAELVSDLAIASKVKGVVCAVDNRAFLPSGLGSQTQRYLTKKGIEVALPAPMCALSEGDVESDLLKKFAGRYGLPKLEISVNGKKISGVKVLRGAPCGNTEYVTSKLIGVSVGSILDEAGKLHREHPCMASMKLDQEIKDTLMNRAAQLLESAVVATGVTRNS